MERSTLEPIQPHQQARTEWTINPIHSTVGFSIKHLVLTTVHGRFDGITGTILFDNNLPVAVAATIDAATIYTGIKKRDDHLRSSDFLDVARFPVITFRSTSVTSAPSHGRNAWVVTGDLSLHGVTRAVDLAVEQTLVPDGNVAEFGATARINRKDFGMSFQQTIEAGRLVVGDELTVALSIRATPASAR